jgi:hypothetical protein
MAARLPCLALPALALGLALTLHAAPARAQVNVEALRSDLDAHARYLSLQASFAGHLGNTNGAVGSVAAFAGAAVDRNLIFVKVQADYAEFSGTTSISKAFVHGRYNVRILPFLYGEAFAQIEENEFQRLALRQVDGVGLRFGVVQRPTVQLFYGTSWMLDYEKLDDEFVFGPAPQWFAQRWNNYLAVGWKMSAHTHLDETFYIQPRINGFADFRLLDDASFVMDIDKRFSAKIDCQIHYNSTPPVGVLPTDVDTVTSLVLTL